MIRLRALAESLRGSLFVVPAVMLAASVALAEATIVLDVRLQNQNLLPAQLVSTVQSARALLSTVAGATISFAGIAISISLLLIQLASSQFSPRVLYGFFRDPFNKRVIGFVIGTFAYCLLVLRVVHQGIEQGAPPVTPNVSVLIATALGITSVAAVVALINHTARSMQVGEIIRRISDESKEQIGRLSPASGSPGEERVAVMVGGFAVGPPSGSLPTPTEPELVVDAAKEGWVQQVDLGQLLEVPGEGGTIRLLTHVGRFVVHGTPLCSVWPVPTDPDRTVDHVRKAFALGRSRTTQQDIGFGIRQLVDIGLKALSPGINDPTTAQEVIVHLGAVLRELLLHDLPPRELLGEGNRRLQQPFAPDLPDFVELSFEQIRRVAASQPVIGASILEVLGMLASEARRCGVPDRAAPLHGEARLVLKTFTGADILEHDRRRLVEGAERLGLA